MISDVSVVVNLEKFEPKAAISDIQCPISCHIVKNLEVYDYFQRHLYKKAGGAIECTLLY